MKIIERPIERIFTFGCSFTDYLWTTWPEYISLDLNIPLWNYGRSGAGNQFMANMVTQADSIHNFNEKDLIMISWSNVCREDRWFNGGWVTPGNIYSQDAYDSNFVKKYVDPVGCLLRDLSIISLTLGYLQNKKCQYHFFSMCDLIEQVDQGDTNHVDADNHQYQNILKTYSKTIKEIKPSFYKILWNNDIYHNKFVVENNLFKNKFSDGHPNPLEHFSYLEKLFVDHKFKDTTKAAANSAQKTWVNFISTFAFHSKKPFAVYNLDQRNQERLKKLTKVVKTNDIRIV